MPEKKSISNRIRENWEMFKSVWSGVTMTFLIHLFTRLLLSSKPEKIMFICISAIVPLPYLFFSIFFLQGLVAIRSILTFKKLGTQDDKRNAIKVKICSLRLLYIFPKDPMWKIRLVMVLVMILEYKNAQVFSCFTVSHSLQQCLFSRFWFFKNQEVLIVIEVTIRVFRTPSPPPGWGRGGGCCWVLGTLQLILTNRKDLAILSDN